MKGWPEAWRERLRRHAYVRSVVDAHVVEGATLSRRQRLALVRRVCAELRDSTGWGGDRWAGEAREARDAAQRERLRRKSHVRSVVDAHVAAGAIQSRRDWFALARRVYAELRSGTGWGQARWTGRAQKGPFPAPGMAHQAPIGRAVHVGKGPGRSAASAAPWTADLDTSPAPVGRPRRRQLIARIHAMVIWLTAHGVRPSAALGARMLRLVGRGLRDGKRWVRAPGGGWVPSPAGVLGEGPGPGPRRRKAGVDSDAAIRKVLRHVLAEERRRRAAILQVLEVLERCRRAAILRVLQRVSDAARVGTSSTTPAGPETGP